jgi:hypothetical protein
VKHGRSLRELAVVPGLGALLPWRLGFRWLSRQSRNDALYREVCDAATLGAGSVFDIGDPDTWKRRHRLVRLVDHCDLWLTRTRSMSWLDRHVDVVGEWPHQGPFIAMTFHWGAGLWALAHLHRHGLRARFLSARIDRTAFQGDGIAYRYARMRNAAVERIGGGPVIYTGGAASSIRDALAAGDVVVALYDLPADDRRSTLTTTVCRHSVRLPAGLARLAATQSVPVVPFAMDFDENTGRRRLRIEPAFTPSDAQAFADRLGESLTRLIDENAAAWHFAAFAPHFFGMPPPA